MIPNSYIVICIDYNQEQHTQLHIFVKDSILTTLYKSIIPLIEEFRASKIQPILSTIIEPAITMTQDTKTYMYLDISDWSARYDATCFYTIQLQGYVWMTSLEHLIRIQQQQQQQHADQIFTTSDGNPVSDAHHNMPMNSRFPTYYYKIIVYRGHQLNIIYRSYPQFEWLYQQLRITTSKHQQRQPNASIAAITIPHPLQGKRNIDECAFFGGHCWVVQQIQEFLDYIQQRRQQHQNSDSTTTTTTTTDITKEIVSNNSTFAEMRCQTLSYFLTTVLEQRGGPASSRSSTPALLYANHNAVRQFLEL
jgi:hypothetical protein